VRFDRGGPPGGGLGLLAIEVGLARGDDLADARDHIRVGQRHLAKRLGGQLHDAALVRGLRPSPTAGWPVSMDISPK